MRLSNIFKGIARDNDLILFNFILFSLFQAALKYREVNASTVLISERALTNSKNQAKKARVERKGVLS